MMPQSIHVVLTMMIVLIHSGCNSPANDSNASSEALSAPRPMPNGANARPDCRDTPMACNSPFECLPDEDGTYACRRSTLPSMEPSGGMTTNSNNPVNGGQGVQEQAPPMAIGGTGDEGGASANTMPGGWVGNDDEAGSAGGGTQEMDRGETETAGLSDETAGGLNVEDERAAGREARASAGMDAHIDMPVAGMIQVQNPGAGSAGPTGGSESAPETVTERCDAVDHDGDGNPYNGFEIDEPCDGNDPDLCLLGRTVCMDDGSGVECVETTQRIEFCDGRDNDCDGVADEDFDLNLPCDGPDTDACAQGFRICNEDEDGIVCLEDENTVAEVCDGQDNDCDGRADEGLVLAISGVNNGPGRVLELGALCDGDDADQCRYGRVSCLADGNIGCIESEPTAVELCDGVDNDCDGQEDEGFALGMDCDGDDTDLCPTGRTICSDDGRETVCRETQGSREEVCDGIDNDCDAVVDEISVRECNTCEFISDASERLACLGEPLRYGQTVCVSADGQTGLRCNPDPEYDLFCDGEDDNNDGFVDNIEPTICEIPGAFGECKKGQVVCPVGCVRGHCETNSDAPTCRADKRAVCEVGGNGLDEDCDGQIDEAAEPYCTPPDQALAIQPSSGWPHPGTKKVAVAVDNNGLVHIAGYSTRRCETYPCVYHAVIDAQDNALFEVVTTRVDDGLLDGRNGRPDGTEDENANWKNDLWNTDIVMHDGEPVVCYRQWNNGPPPFMVAVARRNQGADFIVRWDETAVSDRNAYACALGVLNGQLVMAYGDGTPGGTDQRLMFATEESPGQWVREVADAAPQIDLGNGVTLWPGQVGHQTDMIIHNGVPYIAHRDLANHILRVTAKIDGEWKTVTSPAFNDGRLAGLRPKLAATDAGLVVLHGRAPFSMSLLDNPDQADLGLYVSTFSFDLRQSNITTFREGPFGGAHAITSYEGGYVSLFRERDNTQFGQNTADSALHSATYLGPIWFRESNALTGTALLYRSIDATNDPFGLPVFAYAQTNLAAAHRPPRNESVYLMRPVDTDNDRLPDALEMDGCFDPTNPDVDNDGRDDGLEILQDTDPCMAD